MSYVQRADASSKQSFILYTGLPEYVTPGNVIDVRVYRTKQRPTSVTDSAGNTYAQAGKRKSRWIAKNVVGGPSAITLTFSNQIKCKVVILERRP